MMDKNEESQKPRWKRKLMEYHSKIEKLVVALDHDSAGEMTQKKIIEFCESLSISFEVLNYTGKDPNDALKNLSVCIK